MTIKVIARFAAHIPGSPCLRLSECTSTGPRCTLHETIGCGIKVTPQPTQRKEERYANPVPALV